MRADATLSRATTETTQRDTGGVRLELPLPSPKEPLAPSAADLIRHTPTTMALFVRSGCTFCLCRGINARQETARIGTSKVSTS